MRDPYNILGLGRASSDEEVKRAYRKIAKETHPDMHPGNAAMEQRFKEATTAYDLLSNKEKRGQYDRGEIDAEGKPKGGEERRISSKLWMFSAALTSLTMESSTPPIVSPSGTL